jgi:dihydroxy-acid dehydratase
VPLTIDDFQSVSDRVPYLADLKPSGKFVQEDLHEVGGTPAVMKYATRKWPHRRQLPDGHRQNRRRESWPTLPGLKKGQTIVHALDKPLKESGHIRIMRGNLCPDGAVAKITGKEGLVFTGTARCFDSEEEMLHSGAEGNQKGDVIIIRYEGPQGGPGMPEMLTPTSAIMGAGLGADVALITDGRFLRRQSWLHRRPRHARKRKSAARSPWCKMAIRSRSTPKRTSSRWT